MRVLAVTLGVATAQSFLPEVEFDHFVKNFGKQYQDENERESRYLNFKKNVAEIEEGNLKEGSHTYKVGPLADLNAAEFRKFYLGLKMPSADMRNSSSYFGEFVPPEGLQVASSIDWVSRGAVTPIKDQGQCGSCWTFSTTGAIEGAWQIATGTLLSLSEQQIVDCSSSGGSGCGGGWPNRAIQWEENQKICGESGYPYKGRNGNCHGCSSPVLPAGSVTGAQGVSRSSDSLKAALNTKPVSVCVDANNWQNAGSSLFSNCGTSLDHAVLAVGYDSSSWKVKNSWGTWWADNGYIHLRMGNTCGVLNEAVLALVSGSGPGPTPPGPTPPTPPTPPGPDCVHECAYNSDCPSGEQCYRYTATSANGCCSDGPPLEDVVV